MYKAIHIQIIKKSTKKICEQIKVKKALMINV